MFDMNTLYKKSIFSWTIYYVSFWFIV